MPRYYSFPLKLRGGGTKTVHVECRGAADEQGFVNIGPGTKIHEAELNQAVTEYLAEKGSPLTPGETHRCLAGMGEKIEFDNRELEKEPVDASLPVRYRTVLRLSGKGG